MQQKITPDWSIAKLIKKYPDSAETLVDYGFHCIGCAMAAYETIEQGAKAHGLDEKKLKEMMTKINKIASKKKRKKS